MGALEALLYGGAAAFGLWAAFCAFGRAGYARGLLETLGWTLIVILGCSAGGYSLLLLTIVAAS